MSTKDDFADMRATIEALREARETIERLEADLDAQLSLNGALVKEGAAMMSKIERLEKERGDATDVMIELGRLAIEAAGSP